jgi:CysZ protein
LSQPQRDASPSAGKPIGLLAGIRAFFGGIAFIVITPSVWGYALVPLAMTVAVVLGLTSLGVWGGFQLSGAWIGEANGFWNTLGNWLLTGFVSLLSFLVACLAALVLAQPLSGLALEAIVKAQEYALTGRPSPSPRFLDALWDSLKVAMATVVFSVILLGPLFTITFVFPPSIVVTGPLKFLATGWLLAWNFLDYPLTIRRLGIRQRLRWMGRHVAAVTVFGLAWTLIVFFPGINLLILPMGVAGATRLVVAAEQEAYV